MTDAQSIYPAIVHFDANDPALVDLLGPPASMDWSLSTCDDAERVGQGFMDLTCHAMSVQDDGRILDAHHATYLNAMENADVERRKGNGLYGYAGLLLQEVVSKIPNDYRGRVAIGVNLLGFSVREGHIDQIIRAVKDILLKRKNINKRSSCLVLITRDSEYVVPSRCEDIPVVLRDCIENRNGLRIYVIDYAKRVCYSLDNAKPEASIWRVPVDSAKFYAACNASSSRLLDRLVFGTNVQIGHFNLGDVHIRTHYDVREFLRMDAAREAVFRELERLFKSIDKDGDGRRCIVVVGIHELELYKIAEAFSLAGGARFVIAKSELSGSRGKAVLGESDKFIVLTDIVHTGKEIRGCVESIKQLTRGRLATIRMFAIATMNNSNDSNITSLVKISRNFYLSSDCPLCKLRQPDPNNGQLVSLPHMFRHSPRQLTPFDFWELVEERGALHLATNTKGNRFDVRVSAVKSRNEKMGIIRRYAVWLRKLVKGRLADRGIAPGDVNAVITVDDTSGRLFAGIVAEVLDLTEDNIICMPKENGMPKKGSKSRIPRNARVIIADGCIITGKTLKSLVEYCGDAELVASVVIDCRVPQSELNYMADDYHIDCEVIRLYDWNMGGDEAVNQLKEMLLQWGHSQCAYDPLGTLVDYALRTGASIDQVFDMNPNLYTDAFCDASRISEDGRLALVGYISDDKALEHYKSNKVQNKYRLLTKTAEDILSHKDVEIHRKTIDFEMQKIEESNNADLRDAAIHFKCIVLRDKLIGSRVVPIYQKEESEKIIGTGFLFRPDAGSRACKDKLYLVTCRHVAKQAIKNELSFIFDGHYRHCITIEAQDTTFAYDVSVCDITHSLYSEREHEKCNAFLSNAIGSIYADNSYEVFGYEGKRGNMPFKCTIKCVSEGLAQSGTAEFKLEEGLKVAEGASGSPVLDSTGRLVGMVTNRHDADLDGQSVGVLPIDTIMSYIKAAS